MVLRVIRHSACTPVRVLYPCLVFVRHPVRVFLPLHSQPRALRHTAVRHPRNRPTRLSSRCRSVLHDLCECQSAGSALRLTSAGSAPPGILASLAAICGALIPRRPPDVGERRPSTNIRSGQWTRPGRRRVAPNSHCHHIEFNRNLRQHRASAPALTLRRCGKRRTRRF